MRRVASGPRRWLRSARGVKGLDGASKEALQTFRRAQGGAIDLAGHELILALMQAGGGDLQQRGPDCAPPKVKAH